MCPLELDTCPLGLDMCPLELNMCPLVLHVRKHRAGRSRSPQGRTPGIELRSKLHL